MTNRFNLILTGVILTAALLSGVMTVAERLMSIRQWRSASLSQQEEWQYGFAAPVIGRVRAAIHGNGSLLLQAGLDPALLPYYLFPRRIYQTGTDPETNAVYMHLPPTPYPQRSPESFAVDALLLWDDNNWRSGGELRPAGEGH